MTKPLKKKYYLVDKVIINDKSMFTFDIYVKTNEGKLKIINKKGVVISKQKEQLLLSQKSLYVYEQEKEFYDKFYEKYMSRAVIPSNVSGVYQNVTSTIDKMFENPESLGNLKETKNVVDDLVSVILEDDFTVTSFIEILSYDYYTHTHSLNVSIYALCLGNKMGLSKTELEDLGSAALLHDLGKSKVDKAIINKNGKLTDSEFELVKSHPTFGYELAMNMGITNQNILKGIKYHHEKMDGTGYPDRLKADEIHKFARIIAVCDVFDALTTKRSYKDPLGTFNTLLMMKKDMKDHLDMNIVNLFILIFRDENNL